MGKRVVRISKRKLHDAPDAGLSGPTTPEERIILVETLTREAWAIAGMAMPVYDRSNTPVRVFALGTSRRATDP